MIRPEPNISRFHPDDIAAWPDGDWCHLQEVETQMRWKSDDYERVRLEDTVRLDELGILAQLG